MDPGHVFVFACHHYNLVDTVKRIVVMSRPGRMGVYWTTLLFVQLEKNTGTNTKPTGVSYANVHEKFLFFKNYT